ncbi:MAG: SIS domain-containing protein [Gemmatimonadales bacterium]
MSTGDEALLAAGRRVISVEAEALAKLADRLDGSFVRASRLVAGARGRILVSGVGKSGHVARKIAATLTSTGTPATFLHPVEALHGDLGIVGRDDVAVFVSRSGDTAETGGLVEHLVRRAVPIVAILGQAAGGLGRHATVVLDASVGDEAWPVDGGSPDVADLLPTASTTAALAMGDALAVAVLRLKDVRASDFAGLHPGGALGRKLSIRVAEVMVSEAYPSLGEAATMKDAIAPLAHMRGTVPVVDPRGCVVGVVTAGDLTRLMERETDFLSIPVSDVMTRDPKTAAPDELGSAASRRMEAHGVMALPVVRPDGTLAGVVHLHDLMRAGAV